MLENTAQAILGVAGGGSEALRLDSVTLDSGTALEAYLASGWIEGLQADSIKTLSVNGLQAATALAKSGDWQFRVGAIRLGSDVYRLIFATTALTPDADRRYIESINSFRRISPEEAGNLRPLHLKIVTAAPGDTAQSLSGRMAVSDRPLEYFLLLNGLDRAGALKAGERYKIVTE